MTYIRLDDQITDHPKIVAAGPLAAWLFVAALCYSSRHLTDGAIHTNALNVLSAVPTPAKHAQALIDVGLWERTPTGYQISGYAEWQRTKGQVEDIKQKRAAAGSKGGSNRQATRKQDASGPATDGSLQNDDGPPKKSRRNDSRHTQPEDHSNTPGQQGESGSDQREQPPASKQPGSKPEAPCSANEEAKGTPESRVHRSESRENISHSSPPEDSSAARKAEPRRRDDESKIDTAARLLAEHDQAAVEAAKPGSIRNPDAWLTTAAAKRRPAVELLADQHPALDGPALAALTEPTLGTDSTKSEATLRSLAAGEALIAAKTAALAAADRARANATPEEAAALRALIANTKHAASNRRPPTHPQTPPHAPRLNDHTGVGDLTVDAGAGGPHGVDDRGVS